MKYISSIEHILDTQDTTSFLDGDILKIINANEGMTDCKMMTWTIINVYIYNVCRYTYIYIYYGNPTKKDRTVIWHYLTLVWFNIAFVN